MMKAASVFLRAQITAQDVHSLIQWLENPEVTRYLNEKSCTATRGSTRSCSRWGRRSSGATATARAPSVPRCSRRFWNGGHGKSLPRSAPGTSVRTCSPILRIPKGRNGRAAPPIQYYHGRLSAEAAGDLIHIGLLGTLPMMRWRWTSLFQ